MPIVLDATNKSLIVANSAISSAVVSYWSVDTSNMWTLHSQRTLNLQVNPEETILAAPGAGEVRVVENIWIESAAGNVAVKFKEGGTSTFLGSFSGFTGSNIITMRRDGLFSISTI